MSRGVTTPGRQSRMRSTAFSAIITVDGVRVTAWDHRHDRRVDDAQAFDAVHAQLGIDHGEVVGAHLAGTDRVVQRLGVAADVFDDLVVGARAAPRGRSGSPT